MLDCSESYLFLHRDLRSFYIELLYSFICARFRCEYSALLFVEILLLEPLFELLIENS